ncbi:MAG: hypothetical protein H7839_20470 [Magnetococcus sp. YQC-5]
MASRSSPRKNDTKTRREYIDHLLRDGIAITEPPEPLLDTARELEKTGIIRAQVQAYVLCANPHDRDFPPVLRDCPGKITLKDGLNDDNHEFRCPECERPVFPFLEEKHRFRKVQARIHRQGILSFVLAEMAKAELGVQELGQGVYRCAVGPLGTIFCIADYCRDQQYLTREWASRFPTGYLAVNPHDLHNRFFQEEWLNILSLGAAVSREVDLATWIREVASKPPPSMMANASLPIYSRTVLPVAVSSPTPIPTVRRFVVECGDTMVWIEGERVVAPQAGMRYDIFRVLWDRFLEDLKNGNSLDGYRPISVYDLMEAVGTRQGKFLEDETTVRRTVNRLQEDLEAAVKKKLGLPIDRHDIVETLPWKGAGGEGFGYRLNPRTVIVRPLQSG